MEINIPMANHGLLIICWQIDKRNDPIFHRTYLVDDGSCNWLIIPLNEIYILCTCQLNLTVRFENCFKLATFFVLRFQDWFESTFSCFDLLKFLESLIYGGLVQTKKLSTWKVKNPPQAWNLSAVTSQHKKYQTQITCTIGHQQYRGTYYGFFPNLGATI